MSRILFLFGLVLPVWAAGQIIPYDSDMIEDNYRQEIEARRAREEASFRNKETTLLSDDYFEHFTGLNYFPPDLKFRAVGRLIRLPEPAGTALKLTDSTEYEFQKYGEVQFFLEGQPVVLQVFAFPTHPGNKPTALFIPFTDYTTGEESFGGGRFLIVKIPRGEQIVLDFNLAINPICVYDPEHACPVSPAENFIPVRIAAGAKMYYDPVAVSED